MKLLSQTLSVLLMALFLQGCQLGQDDDETVETASEVLTADEYDGDISNDNPYDLLLKASDTLVTIKGDVTEMTVQGNDNYITIDSDVAIDEVIIVGNGNILLVEDGIELTITLLSVTGNGNRVTVFDVTTYTESPKDGEADNTLCENSICVTTSG